MPLILFIVELKISDKVSATMLVLVMNKLVDEAQTCAIITKTIRDILHSTHYIRERVGNEAGMGGALIILD